MGLKQTITIIVIILYYSIQGVSQSKIKGTLYSYKNTPISFANLLIKNTSKGTITNMEGQFEFTLPVNHDNIYIRASCIGYKTSNFNLDSILNIQRKGLPIILFLQQATYQLDEITIHKKSILKDPILIFKEALNNTPNLLANKASIGKFYFRQTHKDDSSMNRLIEAAISVYDPGQKHNINECKFNIDQLHSTIDNRILPHELNLRLYRTCAEKGKAKHHPMKIDPRIPKAPKKHIPDTAWKNPEIQKYLTKVFDDHYASLSSFFIKANMIRNIKQGRRKKSTPINPKFHNGGSKITDSFVKEHTLKLDTILLYNDEPIYKIKILPNKKYPGIDYQRSRYVPIGWAYIRVNDFAFLGLDYAYISNPNNKGFKYTKKYYGEFKGKFQYYFKYKIRFKEFEGKLYTNYLYYERSDYNNIPYANLFPTEFSEYLNIPTMNGRQVCIQEMVNTEIITDSIKVQTEYQKRRWKGDIYEKRPYSKEFWDNYSQIIPTHEEQLLKGKLLKEIQNKNKK